MRFLLIAALAAAPALGTAIVDAPSTRPLPGNKPCAYPPEAQKTQVAGPVLFEARVRPDGSVESVGVSKVPHPGLDFGAAVKACVAEWRFEPAPSAGADLRSYAGRISFSLRPDEEAALRGLAEAFAAAWSAGDGTALARLGVTPADTRAIPPGDLPHLDKQLAADQAGGRWRMELEADLPYLRFLRADMASFRQPYRRRSEAADAEEDVLEASALKGPDGWRILKARPRANRWLNVVRIGGQIREPLKLKHVPPRYPEDAKRARLQGVVILECIISSEGKVSEVTVLRGTPELNDAAVEAVRQWEYTPTLVDGQHVPVIMTVTVNFRLS